MPKSSSAVAARPLDPFKTTFNLRLGVQRPQRGGGLDRHRFIAAYRGPVPELSIDGRVPTSSRLYA